MILKRPCRICRGISIISVFSDIVVVAESFMIPIVGLVIDAVADEIVLLVLLVVVVVVAVILLLLLLILFLRE